MESAKVIDVEKQGLIKARQKKMPKKKITWKLIKQQKLLIAMSLPFVIWLAIFAYAPLVGWLVAFQNYRPQNGFFGSEWAGLHHFRVLFNDSLFYTALRNTIGMGGLGLVFGTTTAIAFALLLNELRFTRFKKMTQTISYLPHFVSWVVVANLVTTVLSNTGVVNNILQYLNFIEGPINFMARPGMFWGIVTGAEVWKSTGWNAIIYLAAMTAISQEMYEAAHVDGANRFQKMWHITLPSIKPIIIILMIMSIGNIINIGFERQMLLGNNIVADAAIVIEKYALDYGIGMFRYSYGTAIGIFKSVISIVLIFTFNTLAKKTSDISIM
ncbi:ABC transporter permease [Alkalibacterium olivapovliticus]|uniref:Putative aldouronate transport system permease protein n=1 Tax=Alkalibacterium olivapovliticus TaxID=99907 RepID=A0A2T0W666_9LACT|nr:ABC transporter permease subunit [Alkalibacterium olivapovliticus]PRY81353.1 putative aldouronate transport system permease protein [Alkalibacterium olivapovliticus]